MADVETKHNIEDQTNNNTEVEANVEAKQESKCIESKPDADQLAVAIVSNDTQVEQVDKDDNHVKNGEVSNGQQDDAEKTNLIVNYLPQQMTDQEFQDLFKKFGSMKSCKIVRNRSSGYSYGFGFVDFETHEQALQAISELNGHELETKKIKVAFARPTGQDIKQANLYVKNISNDWTQEDVAKIFEPYGDIIQVRVLGNNRGIAFVLYDLRSQAEDALNSLNGKTIEGCDQPLEIKFAADKKEKSGNKDQQPSSGNNEGRSGRRDRGNRGGRNRNRQDHHRQGQQGNQRSGSFFDRQNDRQQGGRQNQYNAMAYGGVQSYPGNYNSSINGVGPVRQQVNRMNRYNPFEPLQGQMGMPNSAAPAAMMAPTYGYHAQQQPQMIPYMIPSQQMMPMQTMNQPGQPMSMNAASMATYPSAAAQMPLGYAPIAQSNMNNIYSMASNTLNNAANMQPQLGQPMNTRQNGATSGSSGHTDDGVTLFVYNIGPDSDETELRTLFGPYGQITKCNVVRKTPGGETKGFGFVTLKDRAQATAAIAGLNGSMRNGKQLQVSFKK